MAASASNQLLDPALAELLPPPAWRKSRRGNLYRRWSNFLLIVFPRGRRYAWCIVRPGEKRFAKRSYATQAEAKAAASAEIGI
jgi:fatty acid desaturase